MARTPYATEIYDTPQKSARIPANSVGYIVIHHAATESFEAVVAMENSGSRVVSSTVVVKDGRVASMFDEVWRAWSLSSQFWDSVSLCSETCNSGGAAQGWPISEASYVTLAKIVADWCIRYGIPCNRERIMGHREVYTRYGASYATACPGGIDLDRLVAMAAAIIAGPTTQEVPMSNPIAVWQIAGSEIIMQFEPGCPVKSLDPLDYGGFSAVYGGKFSPVDAKQGQAVKDRYGVSTDWAKLAPSTYRTTTVGDVTVNADNTAVVKAIEANTAAVTAALAEVTKATKSLNPPG